ncbi:MAG: phasin family protein [Desulfomicrobium escambiense]|nr:phasin family protein [Desulfomicrobium escambiense]
MNDDTEPKAPESMADQVKAVVGKAQEETGRLMDSLVKEGGKTQDQTLKLAEEKVGEVKERVDEVRGMVEDVRTRAADTLENLEQLFEERVSRPEAAGRADPRRLARHCQAAGRAERPDQDLGQRAQAAASTVPPAENRMT